MEQIVKEYLEKAQSKERQIFEKERDDLLVKLGLTKDVVLDNGAESFLGGVNTVMLVVSIIVAIALFFSSLSEIGDGGGYIILGAILLILLSVISFYSVKVILNISNNLHKINAKLK